MCWVTIDSSAKQPSTQHLIAVWSRTVQFHDSRGCRERNIELSRANNNMKNGTLMKKSYIDSHLSAQSVKSTNQHRRMAGSNLLCLTVLNALQHRKPGRGRDWITVKGPCVRYVDVSIT